MIRFCAVLFIACGSAVPSSTDAGIANDGGSDAGAAFDAGREVNFDVDGGQALQFWAIDLPATPIPSSCFGDGTTTGELAAQHFEAAMWGAPSGDGFFVLAPHADLSLGDAPLLHFGAWGQVSFAQRQIAHVSPTAIGVFLITIDVPIDGATGPASLRSNTIGAGVSCTVNTTFTLHAIAAPVSFVGTTSVPPGASRYLVVLRPEPEPSNDCYLSGVAPMPSGQASEGTWEVWTYDANNSPRLRTPPQHWALGDVPAFDVPGTFEWRDIDLRWSETQGTREADGERVHAENITDWVEGAPFQFVSQSWGSLWSCKLGAPCVNATPIQKLQCEQNRSAWAARIE